jgi:discoidin domain receptor family protein 2
VFAKAKVMFSVGGRFYNGRPLVYTYMPDTVLENARNVSINLHGRFGRFVKIQLYFSTRWIMISEVVFESGKISLQCIHFPHLSGYLSYIKNHHEHVYS